MASLLPANAIAPKEVEINVADRLELALKNLISFHGETVKFDSATVSINILVESDNLEVNEHGFSNREIGLTFPFGDHFMGDTVKVNAVEVEKLLAKIKKDLDY